ncbi:MAG: hypothetical protein FIA99_15145 [Ruminiclostridium sp.]|nr:hypothetical protein [Ruminiclostridium sp.]
MGKISVEYDCGVPQLACTDCGNCDSIMGKSLCSTVSRGCCHYFPEFTLAEIQRLLHLPDGGKALDTILDYPGTVINNFNLHAKGHFEKEAYDNYFAGGELLETGKIMDHTIFFRTCPFVREGSGCIFPVRFRTTVCNLFICSEIIENPGYHNEFKPYIEERMRYSRWIYRESAELQHILTENGINLVLNLESSLKLLSEFALNEYKFPILEPVEY